MNTRINVTHFIELNLSQMYGDFRTKEPKAVLEFEIVVYEDKDSISTPVFRKTYKQIQPIEKKIPRLWFLGGILVSPIRSMS